jgi:hypothetical protein
MGYKMKTNIPGLLGMNEEHSTLDIPVFEKNLGKAWGYADMDRTVTINSKLNEDQKEEAVKHEKLHVMQMKKGEAWFDSNNVYHQPKKDEPVQVYPRVGNGMIVKGEVISIGDPENPIEKPIYNKTNYFPTKLS